MNRTPIKLRKSKGYDRTGIGPCCRRKIPFYKGYKWMYLEDYEIMKHGGIKDGNKH